MLEIAKALSRRCQVLLLDEPTSSITDTEFEHLRVILAELNQEGTSIVFVSHKLEEVYALCSRITVLRDGRNVLSGVPLAEVSQQAIVRAMVGRHIELLAGGTPRKRLPGAPPAGTAGRGDGVRPSRHSASRSAAAKSSAFTASSARAARSLRVASWASAGSPAARSASTGRPRTSATPMMHCIIIVLAMSAKIARDEGLILGHSIGRNVGVTVWEKIAGRIGWISDAQARPVVTPPLQRLNVKMKRLSQPAGSLSGGNQQKVSAAKWIAAKAELLIFDEPTVGIDVAAKDAMHRLIVELAEGGAALLVISSDLREVVQLADRYSGDGRLPSVGGA